MIRRIENINLKELNSFGVDATADMLVEFDSPTELGELFDGLGTTPWCVFGGGNNILFSGGWRGALVRPMMRAIEMVAQVGDRVKVRAEAAVEWDDFVAWAVEYELWGAENLSLIPGHVGASPVQNIGAYGVEAKDVIESVEMFCVETRNMLTLSAKHCRFGYRDSIFKRELRGKVVITAVNFTLMRNGVAKLNYGDLKTAVEQAGGETLANIRAAVIAIRQSKLPDPKELGNAGSFFKNPVVSEAEFARLREAFPDIPSYPAAEGVKLAAGWLIDRAGWKGHCRDRVGVHARQALVLVNRGGASGADVLALAADIQGDVAAKFGVDIEMEVNVL